LPTLDWIGKKAVINHHNEVPFHLLREEPELSVGEPGSGNLIVEGDNLTALKALLPYYAGQVKCIYIDPPYNTGVDERGYDGKRTGWIYSDNVNSPEIRKWLNKVVGEEAEDLSRHDKWLCIMYPRLALLQEFLKEDGVLFASIDEIELANLKFILDEIFGIQNRVGTIV
jgi:adenine specific DNA methylase Mod